MNQHSRLPERWASQVEQIKLQTHDKGIRVVGLLACETNSGTSSLARALAHTNGAAGIKTLLIDASQHLNKSGDEAAGSDVAQAEPPNRPQSHPQPQPFEAIQSGTTFDLLTMRPCPAARTLFNNIDAIRNKFSADLASYAAIVVDLPPSHSTLPMAINPISGAVACDGVIIVCMSGRLYRDLLNTTCHLLSAAGANILGVVTNELMNPTLGAEFAREARRLRWISPRASAWLVRKAQSIRYLN